MDEVAEQILELFKDKTFFENVEWTSHSNKYNDQPLCFKDSWNFKVCELTGEYPKKEFKEFYEWLGGRIQYCLNLNRGLTNEELRERCEKKDNVSNERE